MLKKILIASCLLVTSMASQANLISYYGYERETGSNVVTGGGLEWLKWDVTKGMSINSALAQYSGEGWTLASNVQMAAMFNVFQFGMSFSIGNPDWNADETAMQLRAEPTQLSNFPSVYKQFIELFGWTRNCGVQCGTPWTEENFASAMFGSDDNHNDMYNIAKVRYDDFAWRGLFQPRATLYPDYAFPQLGDRYMGVALVRVTNVNMPTPVPLPASLSLLALGLAGLGLRRRQALRPAVVQRNQRVK